MPDELRIALHHHQNGRLDEAAKIYQDILNRNPNNADALHLLGVMAHQQGHSWRAIELIGRAIAINPNETAFRANMAEAYRAVGDLVQAEAACRTALQLQPRNPDAHNTLGLLLQVQGRHEQALVHFQQAVSQRPGYSQAFNNLGWAYHLQNQDDEALATLQKAVQFQPRLAAAQANLGQVLSELGRLEEGLTHCREAIRLQPNSPEGLNNLGNVLRKLGHRKEARGCYLDAIRLAPKMAMAHNNFGQLLQEESFFDQALSQYQTALQLDPYSARFHANLASALHELHREAEAIVQYQRALELDPSYAEAHSGLGAVLQDQGQLSAALDCYRESLRRKPTLVAAIVKQGQTLVALGQPAAAQACWREALRLDPNRADAYVGLATLLTKHLPVEDLAEMERLLASDILPEATRVNLHFALAQVRDAQDQYLRASEHARNANALRLLVWRKQKCDYDPDEHDRYIDQLIETFSAEFFQRVRGWGLDSDLPVFAMGLPRSGKTLVENILAGHPLVFGADELTFSKETFEAIPALLRLTESPLDCVGRWTREAIGQAAGQYLERLQRLAPRSSRIVDTMPRNTLLLGLIATLFPRARIVHCRREPRDVLLACWMTHFRYIRWACDLEHIVARIRAHQRLMEHWRRVLPVPILELNYEETVTDLESVARRVVDWVGLDWNSDCIAIDPNGRSERLARPNQVRLPLHQEYLHRWRYYQEPLGLVLDRVGGAG